LVRRNLLQRLSAVVGLSDDLDILDRFQFFPQHFSGYRLIVYYQGSQGHAWAAVLRSF
jgi:hypothetical protein